MEDSHIAAVDLENDVSVFGVFDGHGGREVALFVKDHYIKELTKLESFWLGQYEQALKESFIRIDEMLLMPEYIKEVKKY